MSQLQVADGQQLSAVQEDGSHSSLDMLIGMTPWLLFSVMTHRLGVDAVGYAACTAIVASTVLATRQRLRGAGLTVIDIAALLTFAVIAVVSFSGSWTTDAWMADFGRGSAALVLAVVMLGSTLFVPFTEQYARRSAARHLWDEPQFRAVNRRISAAWGGAVLAMAVCHLVAGMVDPVSSPVVHARPMDLALNWIVPIVLVIRTVDYGRRVADGARREAAHN